MNVFWSVFLGIVCATQLPLILGLLFMARKIILWLCIVAMICLGVLLVDGHNRSVAIEHEQALERAEAPAKQLAEQLAKAEWEKEQSAQKYADEQRQRAESDYEQAFLKSRGRPLDVLLSN